MFITYSILSRTSDICKTYYYVTLISKINGSTDAKNHHPISLKTTNELVSKKLLDK